MKPLKFYASVLALSKAYLAECSGGEENTGTSPTDKSNSESTINSVKEK